MSDCPEKEALVACAYEECEAAERERVERHLRSCAACAAELDGFTALRGMLREWAPPDARLGFRVVADRDAEPAGARTAPSWWFRGPRPAWGVALAAASVVLAGAALAGVEVRYGDEGLVFRIGWTEPAPGGAAPAAGEGGGAPPGPAAGAGGPPPWRADLAALEEQLRGELAARRTGAAAGRPAPAAAGPVVPAGDDLLREVRALMAESERRQRQEFASGLMRLAQEVDLHRQADQLRMQQEVDSLADYMVRVARR